MSETASPHANERPGQTGQPSPDTPLAVILAHRAVLTVEGPDARAFLQGLISNDVERVGPERTIWAAFLTPQGKFLQEFFLAQMPAESAEGSGALLLDCEAERRAGFLQRLTLYRLRSKVTLADSSADWVSVALPGPAALAALSLPAEVGAARSFGGGVVYTDPRLPALGARALLPRATAEESLREAGFRLGDTTDYDRLRLSLGVPDGSRDLEVDKATLMESGFDELNGIDWKKGCYLGQELTARMKYRGLSKKRLLPVRLEGGDNTAPPEAGTPILAGERSVGELRSAVPGRALALLRLSVLEGDAPPELTAGGQRVLPERPDWLRLPEAR